MQQANIHQRTSLQSAEQREKLVQQLKTVSGALYKAVRAQFALLQQDNDDFCLQTAYSHFVRIFLVRMCEDYGLISYYSSHQPSFAHHNQTGSKPHNRRKDT